MTRLAFAVLAGVAFGAFAVATMIPMSFPDKREALLAAFLNRFATGFLIPLVALGVPAWETGLIVGLLLSLPPAIITRAYAPIIGIGTVGGLVIGLLTARFAPPM